jgi:hypothetical protein
MLLQLPLLFTGCDRAPLRGQQPKASGSGRRILYLTEELLDKVHWNGSSSAWVFLIETIPR